MKVYKPRKKREKTISVTTKDLIDFFENNNDFVELKLKSFNYLKKKKSIYELGFEDQTVSIRRYKALDLIEILLKRYMAKHNSPLSIEEYEQYLANPEAIGHKNLNIEEVTVKKKNLGKQFVSDRKAISLVKKKIRELEKELKESISLELKEEIETELEKYKKYLRSDTYKGKIKSFADEEKTQEALHKNLKDFYDKLGAHHPKLASHFRESIKWKKGFIYWPSKPQDWRF